MSHTPGPWTWAEKYRGLYGSGQYNEVLSWYSYEGMHLIQGDTEANAKLIAAAPDLLAALQRIVDADDSHELSQMDIEAGRVAITKATS